ncbi:Arginyl-tRNA--protein transferase 1 [Ophidiomyces ophidiicola]|nr:Arginyl-tRNA--protein transferase 1 [Ophidiomyces ophidiicola]
MEVSASFYASSTQVRVQEYEELLTRGWRRSGTLYYKQNLERSCCPHYTMRLEAAAYKPRKDQRKALNRWNRFVLGQEYIRNAAMLCPKTRQEAKSRKNTFDLRQRVHEAEYSQLPRPINPKTKLPIEPAHKFEVKIEADSLSLENYDPDYEQWEFGKLSAMRELAMAIEEGYKYYYMGFYIHSCPKMLYKAAFRPQFLLDPETLLWNPLECYTKKLARRRYVSLSESHDSDPEKENDDFVLPNENEMSLFDIRMPGVMTLKQLEASVDLDHWRLLVRSTLVDMDNLVDWDTSNIKEPHSIKGIVAELAAALGPKVVQNSAVILFPS